MKRAVSLKERQYNLADWWRTVTFAWKAAACTVALAGIIIGGALAKQPFGRVAPTTSVQKALFADNEPSLSKTYTTIVIAGR
ncbi:MAG: hypothetical protein A2Z82_11715 [Nitrospirae bacterium GWA2_46_11]|nr:MAG: hypothetical protein A2Z82_11715 [Nitrospirae bacterium GWA2_46_11]